MTTCSRIRTVQDYLDQALSAEEAREFRAHLESCAECSGELALFSRVFTALREAPLWNPGPALTERVLDRVVPSRLRRRWVTAIGWSYAVTSAVTTFAFISWIARPETHVWLGTQFSEASVRVFQTALFVVHTLAFAWFRLIDGWVLIEAVATGIAPLGRAFTLTLTHPLIAATLSAALITCTAVLWWMRPRRETQP